MLGIPVAERKLKKVKIGHVDGEQRGINLMNPPKELDDYYYWLRDDTRKNSNVLEYLKKENAYTKSIIDKHQSSINDMFTEIKSHINENYETYPTPQGEGGWNSKYRYFTRTKEGLSYPIYCRRNMEKDFQEVLLDINILGEGKSHCDVSSFEVTKNHEYMSYGIDYDGNEKYKFIIQRINDKKIMQHNIPELPYCDYFWHKNNIYYVMADKSDRMFQVWKYNFLTKINTKLYQNDNEVVEVGISMSNDEKYFFISASSFDTSEQFYFTNEDPEIKLFSKKMEGVLYTVDYHEGKFLILTNKDGARNFKLMITDLDKTSSDNWIQLIQYDDSKYIKGIHEIKDYLLVIYKQEGNNYIGVIKLIDGKYDLSTSYNIEIEEEIKNIGLSALDIYDTNIIWYTYDSLNTPVSLYSYNLETKERLLLREKEVPNFNKIEYECLRLHAKNGDVNVPMSMIYKKSMFKPGENPVYLYGYGSYGITVDPDFSSKILPLLNRGFVYVIAHVRGGSFLGYKWYEDGKMKNKMNTFNDFIACAEYLIKEKYTFPKGITIEGRSAGGLLVGACMTMRPDLFHTVIGGVPFVDVLTTMSDPSIPLTTPEWEQWGNPNQEEHYKYMRQYSPYNNIRATEYPNTLILAGLNDPRVQYWEPAKFVAKLRHYKTDNNLLLLKTEMEEGHFSGSDRYKYMKELAFSYIFVLKSYNLLSTNTLYNIQYTASMGQRIIIA